ncbi:MAG: cytochrome c3 family protein, partial [Gemmatimonadetes bacterium]|nr:cytochrome c3 family protein [Gemmatimonadota bacterium]
CMGCHIIIAAADTAGNPDPDIAKLRDYAARGEPIPWVRINKIAEHARFPHMRHVSAAIACQTCHGNVQQMPRVFPVQNLNRMGWCTSCHMRRGVTRDCTTCHF